ncbi:MAG TPA: peptidoglycan-binding protein LysM [Thermoanaerobaculia bacterium]|nr:peptidoglycan-binding protein LysM [Thermoanaerobaculia bacterium]
MGLIDFIKGAGAKIFGKEAPPPEPHVDPEEHRRVQRENALLRLVSEHGLEVEGLRVQLVGDTVIAEGRASSQALREKVVLALGNVEGVAHVDDRIEVVVPEPPSQYHTVVSGDNLSKIAKRYYGNANKYPVIFEANQPMLKHPDKIYPGQVLRIPPQA